MHTVFRARAADGASHGIDLAPMLDFVVNLLIFFIISAVFVKQAGLSVARPSNSARGGVASKTVVIDEHGEVSIDARAIDLRAVRAHIEQVRAADSNDGVVIVAHEHAPTGRLVEVIDQIHLGGIYDITFSTAR